MKGLKIFLGVALFAVFSVDSFAVGEKVLKLGGENGWGSVKTRKNITEIEKIRPNSVLALSSAMKTNDPSLDMAISFDESDSRLFSDKTGHYVVSASDAVHAAQGKSARLGRGAALFYGSQTVVYSPNSENGPLRITPKPAGALFSGGRNLGSWSIEFWLYPSVMETGDEIVTWSAVMRKSGSGSSVQNYQNIKLTAVRNKLSWDFSQFFTWPNNDQSADIRLMAGDLLVPRKW